MADYEQTSISKNAKRVLAAPLSLTDFSTAVAAFQSAVLTGASKEIKSVSLQTPVIFADAAGNRLCRIVDKLTRKDTAMLAGLSTVVTNSVNVYLNATEIPAILGGEAVADKYADTVNAVYAVDFAVKMNGDTVHVVFRRDAVYFLNYANDATAAALDAWCDEQSVLRQ